MRGSRLIGGLVVATVVAVGGYLVLRRRAASDLRADLYFADGSSLTLDREAPEADRLVAAARSRAGLDA